MKYWNFCDKEGEREKREIGNMDTAEQIQI